VTAVTVATAFLADDSPPADVVAMLAVGMLGYQFAIGTANDAVDALDDARNKPWKAIPRGLVSRRAASLLAAGFAGVGMVATAGLPFGAWLVGIAGLACGLVYDVQLKRTWLSWAPMALALPLVPVWVFLALEEWDPLLWWVFPLGALLGLGLHLANQAPDVPKESEMRGLAHRLGTEKAADLALVLVALAGVVACAVLIVDGAGTQAILAAGTVLLAGTMAGRSVRLFGPDGLFGLLASTSAALAVTFLSAVG